LKVSVLEPSVSPAEALSRVIRQRMDSLPRKDAKAIALALASNGDLSLRQISELTHVSRDTMRRAGIHGG
jgi:DNA-directed RNA polymerase specialized sigma24 family protein